MSEQQQQQQQVPTEELEFGEVSTPDPFSLDTTAIFPRLLSDEALSMLRNGSIHDFSRLADQLQTYQNRVDFTIREFETNALNRAVHRSQSRSPRRIVGDIDDDDMITDDHTAVPSYNFNTIAAPGDRNRLKTLGCTRAMKQRTKNLLDKVRRLSARLIAVGLADSLEK